MRFSSGAFAGSARGTSRNCMCLSAMMPALSGRAPQVLDQRADRCGLGLHHPELADVSAQIGKNLLGPDAPRLLHVLLEQPFQVLHVRLHSLGVNAADVDELVVVAIDEIAI